jgi:hypothetical protein
MINNRLNRDRGVWLAGGWFALAMTGLLLQGCSEAPKPEAAKQPGPRLFAADVNGGAKVCDAPKLKPAPGKPADAAMTVGNDGGWCGMTVVQAAGEPFDAGLLPQPPLHGKVLIHKVGDVTRIDYTPDQGFTGADSFVVTLIPGDAAIHTAVTVQPR